MTKIPHKPKYDQNTPKTEKNIYKDRNTPKPLKKEKEKPHSSLNVFWLKISNWLNPNLSRSG